MTTTSRRESPPARPADDLGSLRRCPFLISDSGAWVAPLPSVAHRCGAVAPPAALSPDKQRRLCLGAAHEGCATFLAAGAARADRIPAREREVAHWGWVRTTPVVDARLGLGASLVAIVGDRRRWQAVPALVLVVALAALGLSNLGGGTPTPSSRASDAAAASPTAASSGVVPSASSSGAPAPTSTPTAAPTPTAAASATTAPSPAPTPTPAPSARTTYTVKAGDSLYVIALKYGVTVAAIKDLNGLASNTLHVGQKLLIP